MADFEHALRLRLGSPAADAWTYLRPTFDYRRDFVEAARQVQDQIGPPRPESITVFVTYSMGGLVARQLVAWGYPCAAMLSVSAPHGGVPWWSQAMKLAGHDAPWSLRPRSPQLRKLNSDPRDVAHRGAYHLFGVVYRAGPWWAVGNDGFLTYRSQVGIPGAAGNRIELRIREPERLLLPLVAVHGRLCHHPRAVAPMLDRAADILRDLTAGLPAPTPATSRTLVEVPRLPRSR